MRAWTDGAKAKQANAPQRIAASFLEVGCTGAILLRGGPEKGRPSLNYNKIRWLNKLGGKNSPEGKRAKMGPIGRSGSNEPGDAQAA
jgi:hypothetical protein